MEEGCLILVTEPTPLRCGHGGGIIAYKQAELLYRMGILDCIMTTSPERVIDFPGIPVVDIKTEDSPLDSRFDRASPWRFDAVVCHELMHLPAKCRDIFINGGGFPLTVEYARSKAWKIVTDCAPHNVEESAAEKKLHGIDLFQLFPHLDLKGNAWPRWASLNKYSDLVFSPSRKGADYIAATVPMERHKICVVYRGVDIHEKNAIDISKVDALHVSQWGHDKGQLYLMRAWIGFIRATSNTKAHLDIAGYHTEMIPSMYHIDCDVQTTFRGEVSQEELEGLYRKSNLYLHTSVTEGFGLTITEAMSYGMPVLTSDGAGASELVNNGVNGFVFGIRDVNALANLLAGLASDPRKLIPLGNAAYETAREYSWERWARETKTALEKVL